MITVYIYEDDSIEISDSKQVCLKNFGRAIFVIELTEIKILKQKYGIFTFDDLYNLEQISKIYQYMKSIGHKFHHFDTNEIFDMITHLDENYKDDLMDVPLVSLQKLVDVAINKHKLSQ